jgi:hypothetical protein
MAYGKKVEQHRFGYMMGSFLACAAIVYLSFNLIDAWHKYKESAKRLEASTASVAELTEQYEELKKAKALETSSTGYEMHVRSKFDLAKEGEQTVFITTDEAPAPIQEDKGIKKILNTFKNFFN